MLEETYAKQEPKPAEGLLGKGYNVLPGPTKALGTVHAVRTPADVMQLVRARKDLSDTVILTRGGAVTFAGPLLMKKPAGVITIEGAPESHMGILAREFSVPAVMSIELADISVERLSPAGIVRDEYAQHVLDTLNGRQVQLDCTDPLQGRVLAASAAVERPAVSPV